jgi:hypothetical protein
MQLFAAASVLSLLLFNSIEELSHFLKKERKNETPSIKRFVSNNSIGDAV